MAWAFLVKKKINGLGEEVPLQFNDYGKLLIAKPRKFKFDLHARSMERGKLVLENWEELQEKREKTAAEG